MLGRRGVSGASRTARDAGRSWKEAQDKAAAEAELRFRERERADLEAQFQSELSALDARINPLSEELEVVSIAPVKGGISVRLTSLVWAPHWIDAQGRAVPAWQ